MKVIQSGYAFRIHDDGIQTHDYLPAQAYIVEFNPMSGPSLRKYSDITINEKIYGVHLEKAEKVLKSFKMFERNLGVILSGDKGIGKSLFSKVLSQKAISEGYPLIIVNSYFEGISEFLNQIEQEVVVLFDEFDKTFPNIADGGPQAEMLTLFDGIAQGKKLFCVTCNDLSKLNSFLVNRPGRFHYHFRFEYPNPDEIREYLTDKLTLDESIMKAEIEKVVSFSQRVSLNFDCLRAIAFELNLGIDFETLIKDLNIIQTGREKFNLKLRMSDGSFFTVKGFYMDSFSDLEHNTYIKDPDSKVDLFYLKFVPADSRWSQNVGGTIISAEDLDIEFDFELLAATKLKEEDRDHYDNIRTKLYETYKDVKPLYLEVSRAREKSIHYSL